MFALKTMFLELYLQNSLYNREEILKID